MEIFKGLIIIICLLLMSSCSSLFYSRMEMRRMKVNDCVNNKIDRGSRTDMATKACIMIYNYRYKVDE